MELTEEQKEELAQLLATHLVGFATRRATAEEAGMPDAQVAGDPEQSWKLLIEEALERGRLRHLLAAAALQAPGDTMLAAISESAERGTLEIPEEVEQWSFPWRTLGVGFVGAVFIVVLVLLGVRVVSWMSTSEDADDRAAIAEGEPGKPAHVPVRDALLTTGEETPARAPAPTGEPEAQDTDQEGTGPDTELQVLGKKYIKIPEPPSPPPEEVVKEEGSADPAPTPPPSTGAGCKGPAGQVVGYAYAGSSAPTIAGGRWTLDKDVNVRATYPTAENGYDTTGRVVCVLRSGSVVPAGAPIPVAGGAFWVPVKGAE